MVETATEKLQALESEPSSDATREKLRKEKYDNAKLRLRPLSSCVVGFPFSCALFTKMCLLTHVISLTGHLR